MAAHYYTPQFHEAFLKACKAAGAKYPQEHATLRRAALLVIDGAVVHGANNEYVVLSGTTDGRSYVVNGSCECKAHARAPGGRCKHRYSVWLYRRAMRDQEHTAA